MPLVTSTTRLFGVIADPIAHVQAPQVFNRLFAEKAINAVLIPIQIRPSDLSVTLPALARLPNMGGVAVTIPHKLAAAKLCHTLGGAAKVTSAVNAIRFDHDGSMHGENFDGKGFVAGLIGEGKSEALAGTHVLLLGAGGAARAIAWALAEFGADKTPNNRLASLHIANRSQPKARDLAQLITQHYPNLPITTSLPDLAPDQLQKFGLIINSTSLGLQSSDPLPISLKGVAQSCVIADIIMQPDPTAWLDQAVRSGLVTHHGSFMLAYQRDLIAKFLGML